MSADDYLYIAKRKDERFGIIHCMGEEEAAQERIERTPINYSTLEEAVLRAHLSDDTEYGVRVNQQALGEWLVAHAES